VCMCVDVYIHSCSFSVVLLAVCGIQCLSNPPGNTVKLPKYHPASLFTLTTLMLVYACLSFLHLLSTLLFPPFISFLLNHLNIVQFHLFPCSIFPVFIMGLELRLVTSSSLYSCCESSQCGEEGIHTLEVLPIESVFRL